MIIETFMLVAKVIFVYMSAWYILSLIIKRADIADIAWGIGFIVAASVPLFVYGLDNSLRAMFVTVLVVIWGSRLSYHIFRRNSKKSEDARYVAWRTDWGKSFVLRSYLQIFLLQGALLFVIVSPVVLINTVKGPTLGVLDVVGVLVWLVGFFFESQGDAQLRRFISNPENKGKILDTGLWKYTRHPNYFGEVTQWWGIWIIALSVPSGAYAIVGPLMISFLILKVSGVPMLEKSMSQNPLFDDYRRRTSVFIPWIPKK